MFERVYIGYKIIVFVGIAAAAIATVVAAVVKILLLELLPRYLPIRIRSFSPSFEKGQLHSREQQKKRRKKALCIGLAVCFFHVSRFVSSFVGYLCVSMFVHFFLSLTVLGAVYGIFIYQCDHNVGNIGTRLPQALV